MDMQRLDVDSRGIDEGRPYRHEARVFTVFAGDAEFFVGEGEQTIPCRLFAIEVAIELDRTARAEFALLQRFHGMIIQSVWATAKRYGEPHISDDEEDGAQLSPEWPWGGHRRLERHMPPGPHTISETEDRQEEYRPALRPEPTEVE
jgi:hypothetical protein